VYGEYSISKISSSESFFKFHSKKFFKKEKFIFVSKIFSKTSEDSEIFTETGIFNFSEISKIFFFKNFFFIFISKKYFL